jgi:hypothetical protein
VANIVFVPRRRMFWPGGKTLAGVSGLLDSLRTKEEHVSLPPSQRGSLAMSAPSSLSDNRRYEQACDQAIAMCDGNLRSTIKALIMANEYLEAELEELQAAIAAGCVPKNAFSSEAGAGPGQESAMEEPRVSSSAA